MLVKHPYIIYPRGDLKQFKGFFIQGNDPGIGAIDRGNTGVIGQVRALFTGHVRASDYFDLFIRIIQV